MTLIRIDTLKPWNGEPLLHRTKSAQLHRRDGTVEDVEVKEYSFEVRHPSNIGEVWTDEELLAAGLVRPEPFVLPEGKQIVGDAFYVMKKGIVKEVFPVQDIPPPPAPEPEKLLTPIERLQKAGLTVKELKELLKEEVEKT
jgi:hypothetical protein